MLTTQLYFPDEAANTRGGIFHSDLVMQLSGGNDSREALFAFVVRT